LALAAFLGLVTTGVMVNNMARTCNTAAEPAVAQLKRNLPAGTGLVSLGAVDHLFAYYYRDPIPALPWPEDCQDPPPGLEYFCFTYMVDDPCWPAFPFQQVDVVCCDSTIPSQDRLVIVGRIPRDAVALAERQRLAGR
jgi:hypothetical protein